MKMCRNPRCGCRLPEPVENAHAAFCTRGCWEQYHRARCVVCERPFERKAEHQHLCGRRKCKADLRAWPAVYLPFQAVKVVGTAHSSSDARTPHTNPHSTGIKTNVAGLRGWRWVEVAEGWQLYDRNGRVAARLAAEGDRYWVCQPGAAPKPPIESFEGAWRRAEVMALWALPLDPGTAARARAMNRAREIPGHGYDGQDDLAKSLNEGYRVIRERIAAGGAPWIPQEAA
jgi:hypothetical protein